MKLPALHSRLIALPPHLRIDAMCELAMMCWKWEESHKELTQHRFNEFAEEAIKKYEAHQQYSHD